VAAARRRARALPDTRPVTTRRPNMELNVALQPILSLIAGILILIMPKLLNYIVAIYLIIFGVLGLMG
jgi:hypothetical protein